MENSADATAATPQMPTTQDGTGVEASPGPESAEEEEGEGIGGAVAIVRWEDRWRSADGAGQRGCDFEMISPSSRGSTVSRCLSRRFSSSKVFIIVSVMRS